MRLSFASSGLAIFSLISAQAQTATTKQTSAASASFNYVSDDGCVQNEVIVFANSATVGAADQPKTTATVTYSRYRYDYCDDSDLGTDVGNSPRPTFSGDLNKASLYVTINGLTASGSATTISFELVWVGTGGTVRLPDHPQNKRAANSKVVRSENMSRNAVVRGTIDGQNVSGGMISANLHTTRNTISQ
jgi:hypothetical protein